MFCPNCGKEMNDNATFCSNCGYSKSKNNRFKLKYFIFVFIAVIFVTTIFLMKAKSKKLSYKEQIINQIETLDDIVGAAQMYWYRNSLRTPSRMGDLTKRENSIDEEKRYTITLGNYKGEPIKWIPLYEEDKKIYLISKYILDVVPYKILDIDKFHRMHNVGWVSSSLRRFANQDFYYNAFNEEEKELLCQIVSSFVKQDGETGMITTYDNVLVLRDDMYEKVLEKARFREVGTAAFEAWGTEYARNTGLLIGNSYKYGRKSQYSPEEVIYVKSDYPNGECWYYMCGGKSYDDGFAVQYINAAGSRVIESSKVQYPLMTYDWSKNQMLYKRSVWPNESWAKRYKKSKDVLGGFRPVICIDLNE